MSDDSSKVKVQITGENRATHAFNDVARDSEQSAGRMRRAFSVSGNAVAGALLALGRFVFTSTSEMVKMAETVDNLSQRTGIATETLSALAYQADLAGSNIEGVAAASKTLAQNLVEARRGSVEAQEAFAQVGVAWASYGTSGAEFERLLRSMADRFKEMPDGAEKSAAAYKLFGKAGGDLVPLLNEGSEGMAKARREAEDMGLVFSKEKAAQLGNYGDELEKLGKAARSAAGAFGVFLVQNTHDSVMQTTEALQLLSKNLIADGRISFEQDFREHNRAKIKGFLNVDDLREYDKMLKEFSATSDVGVMLAKGAAGFYEARTKLQTAEISEANRVQSELNVLISESDAGLRNAAIAAALYADEMNKLAELERRSDFGAGIRAGLDETRAELSDFFAQAHGMTIEFLRGTNQDWKTLYFDTMQGRVEGLGQFFGRFFNSMVVQIQQIAAQQAANATTSLLLSGLSGIFGGAPASASGNQPTALINPGAFGSGFEPPAEARATGGPVVAGRSYLVGEKRAEIFRPREDGMIQPSAGGGGTSVTMNIYAVDAASFMQLAGQNADGLFQVVVSVAGKDPNARNALRGVIG